MLRNKERGNGITEGVIWTQLLLFFFPLLFGTFFQQLYNTIDAVVVGRTVGKEALSAVGGSSGTIINVFIGFFIGVSTGATVTISQYYGAKQKEEVSKAVHTAIALAIISGIVITVIGIIFAPAALSLMGTPKDIMPYSVTFLRIYFIGMTANLLYNIGAGILRAIGNSSWPLLILAISCLINIVLDIILVVLLHLNVAGAAAATVISQAISAIMVIISLVKTTDCYHLNIRQIKIHKEMLARIIRIGLPAGIQSLMYTSSNVIIQSNINSFGTNTVAAWTAYGKIDCFFWMMINAFGISATTFAGQNYGAGKYDRVRKGVRTCLIMAMSAAAGLSIILYFCAPYIYILFTTDALVIKKGMEIIHFLVPTFITYVCVEILSGSLRGMGNSFIPMVMTSLGICVLRVVWLFTAVPVWHNFNTVIFSYPLTWTVTSILFIFYYRYYTKRKLCISQ